MLISCLSLHYLEQQNYQASGNFITMNAKFRFSCIIVFLLINSVSAGKWPGNAVIGTGRICGVYSDDPGITAKDGLVGFRHLYFKDYSADYIKSTKFEIFDAQGKVTADSSLTGLSDFFTVSSSFFREGKILHKNSVRAGIFNGFIFQCHNYSKEAGWPVFTIDLNDKASPDGQVKLTEVKALKNGQLFIKWSNNVFFILYSDAAVDVYKKSSTILELNFTQSKAPRVEVFLLVGTDEKKLTQQADSLNQSTGLWSDSEKYWDSWIRKGLLPYPNAKDSVQLIYNNYYSRNLYAAYCSNLNGLVPADITGHLLTKGLPQLYPRNAMMVARNLMECGYSESAGNIIRFWSSRQISHDKHSEFYARYDASGDAVDAGSGVRYDEPEWDAGGYLICLLHDYYLKYGILLADTSLIYDLADFLAESIDSQGLLYESGIVEWTGYLPATNMIVAAGLMSAAEFAIKFGRADLNEKYSEAWRTISKNLVMLYDTTRQTYTARRYWADKSDGYFNFFRIKGKLLYLWDATNVFGVLWGFPDDDLMRLSYDYTWENLTDGGGVRFFEAHDKGWLTDYGLSLVFSVTASNAKYAVRQHIPSRAAVHIDWMIENSNTYGLMPDRILSDYSGTGEASPDTWSCSEFAASIKLYAKSR